MPDYKFDRSAFRMRTFKQADASNVFDKNVTLSERLRQAYYLISLAFGFTMDNQPKLDKGCFSIRKLGKE
jgi:hypothetical protein